MIQRKYYLYLRKDTTFFSTAKRLHFSDFSLYVQQRKKEPKVVVVVPKKEAKKATQRNRIKRMIYTFLQGNVVTNQSFSKQVVVIVRRSFIDKKPQLQKESLERLEEVLTLH